MLRATKSYDPQDFVGPDTAPKIVTSQNLEKANWNRVFNTKVGNILHTAKYIEINGISYGDECKIQCHPKSPDAHGKAEKDFSTDYFTVTLSIFSTPTEFESILKKSGLL